MSKKSGIVSSFSHAIDGLVTATKKEPNFQIHLVISTLVILTAFYFRVSKFEWMMLLFSIFFVLILELLNTMLEALVDLVQPKYHVKAKVAKDVSAAGVLMGAIVTSIIATIIFLPRITAII